MNNHHSGRSQSFVPSKLGVCRPAQRGVALVMTLLLLSVLTALALGMAISLGSQTLIGGYYRNFRGSFYAADSGTNIAVQYMSNQLVSNVPATFATPPISNVANVISAVQTGVSTNYGTSTALNVGNAAGSWRESFQIQNPTLTLVSGPTATAWNTTTAGCTVAVPCPTAYTYTFSYSLTSVGAAQGTEQANIQETGTISLGITGQAASNSVSFAYFGGFVDQYSECLGPLVPGTMTGPMFTNDQWEFMPSMSPWTAPYIFTDPVGQHSGHADYWDTGWGCHQSTATSYGSGANLVAPTFQQGFQMGQPTVALPTNSFSQEWAVIDGLGTGEGSSAPTAAQLHTDMQTISGTAYPSSTPSSGVFLTDPGTTAGACGTVSPPCVKGGGFLVEGNAQILLQPSGSTAQVYQITQGSTVTTITIDPAANGGVGTTTITQGSTTYPPLNGVPWNNITNQASTMIYVDGAITSLSGPGEGQAAIQDNAMITLSANGDVTATGDVLYKTEPVTYTQNQIIPGSSPACCNGTPLDYLIPSVTNMNQVLGIYTANGNFITTTHYGDQNIQVDGSIATISSNYSNGNCGSGGGFLAGDHINTFNNVGGQIQSCIYAADINAENIWFDRRFTARPNFAPPWFPSTTLQQGGPLPTNTTPQISRVQWVNTTAL